MIMFDQTTDERQGWLYLPDLRQPVPGPTARPPTQSWAGCGSRLPSTRELMRNPFKLAGARATVDGPTLHARTAGASPLRTEWAGQGGHGQDV